MNQQKQSVLYSDSAAWYYHHLTSAFDAFQRMILNWLPSLMTSLVIGVAIALPAVLFLSISNLESVAQNLESRPQISVFLKKNVSVKNGKALANHFIGRENVESAKYISAKDALEEFQQVSEIKTIVESLGENPLPATIVIYFVNEHDTTETLKTLATEIKSRPDVDNINIDLEWLQRLQGFMGLGKRITFVLTLLLSLAVILIVGNTIRMAVENRRSEVQVIKLVGATDGFIRRPFLYMGFLYGFVGGVLAWIVLVFLHLWLKGSVSHLASLYNSDFTLINMSFADSILLWMSGAFLGWLGALIAVNQRLKIIEDIN